MIATTTAIKRDRSEPVVDDPRRSYDRGIWVGALAGETSKDDATREHPIDLASISIDGLRRELDRRQKGLDALLARRARLAQELAALDAEIRGMQAADVPVRRAPSRGQSARLAIPRLKNSISLPDAVALEAEVGQVVTPPEIAKRVLASGYQTTSKSFTAMCTNTLSNDPRFKRVGRGRYERLSSTA